MNKTTFTKEFILKNDLTYLTICYFIFLTALDIQAVSGTIPFILSGIWISVSWYLSFTRKNIFNSALKFIIIPALIIFTINIFTPIDNLQFSGAANMINGLFFTIYASIIAYLGFHFISPNTDKKYAVFAVNCRQAETEYLKNTFRVLNADSSIAYHYDERVNLYTIDDKICLAGNSFFIKESEKVVVGSLSDYYRYFKDLNIDYNSMNEDSLEVFKMYAI